MLTFLHHYKLQPNRRFDKIMEMYSEPKSFTDLTTFLQDKKQQDESNKDYNDNANDDMDNSHSLLRTLNQINIKNTKQKHRTITRGDNLFEDEITLQVVGEKINKEDSKQSQGHKYDSEHVSKIRITKRARGDSVKPEEVMTCQQLDDKCVLTCAKRLEWCTEWKKKAISY